MAKKPKPLAVHIVLETSCLFTDAADKLIKDELSEFILSTISRHEIDVTWHLPFMARDERRYQMLVRAERLLPQLDKVERLLGHKFGITGEILEQRVEAVISREVTRHSLKLRNLDTATVDWVDLISRSVRRRPPFDPGEKEKGFRDAVMLEIFRQIISELPKSPQSCRIILMTGDQLLIEAANEIANDRSNVTCIGDIEEIQTMLNALASELTEEVVRKVLPAAEEIFWTNDDQGSLYYKEKVASAISTQFKKELAAVPSGFARLDTKKILIRTPAFLSKTNQRLTFSSRITYEVEATKIIWRSPPVGLLSGLPSAVPRTPTTAGVTVQSGVSALERAILGTGTPTQGALSGMFGSIAPSAGVLPPPATPSPPQVQDVIRRPGQHVFEVFWSVILTAGGSLKNAKIERIEYKESVWEEEP